MHKAQRGIIKLFCAVHYGHYARVHGKNWCMNMLLMSTFHEYLFRMDNCRDKLQSSRTSSLSDTFAAQRGQNEIMENSFLADL